MAKIRVIERNHKKRMKITLTNPQEIRWLTGVLNCGVSITEDLCNRGELPSTHNWQTVQYNIYLGLQRAQQHIEH